MTQILTEYGTRTYPINRLQKLSTNTAGNLNYNYILTTVYNNNARYNHDYTGSNPNIKQYN